MKIKVTQDSKGRYRADPTDLPGTPANGLGRTLTETPEPVPIEDITPGWYWLVEDSATTTNVLHVRVAERDGPLVVYGDKMAYTGESMHDPAGRGTWYRAPSPEELMAMCMDHTSPWPCGVCGTPNCTEESHQGKFIERPSMPDCNRCEEAKQLKEIRDYLIEHVSQVHELGSHKGEVLRVPDIVRRIVRRRQELGRSVDRLLAESEERKSGRDDAIWQTLVAHPTWAITVERNGPPDASAEWEIYIIDKARRAQTRETIVSPESFDPHRVILQDVIRIAAKKLEEYITPKATTTAKVDPPSPPACCETCIRWDKFGCAWDGNVLYRKCVLTGDRKAQGDSCDEWKGTTPPKSSDPDQDSTQAHR